MKNAKNSVKYLALIAWLKDARENKKLTTRDVGLLIDEPHSFVVKLEAGDKRLNVYQYVQYCSALDLNPSDGLEFLK